MSSIRSRKKHFQVALPLNHQRGQLPRKVHPPRSSQHAAPVVGAPPAGRSACGRLFANGERPRWRAGLLRRQNQVQADAEREELFQILQELAHWENTNNEEVLARAPTASRSTSATAPSGTSGRSRSSAKGPDTITVTANEIRYGLNQKDKFVLPPFTQEPDCAEASKTLNLGLLLKCAATAPGFYT